VIKTLSIENVQAHVNSELNFHEGVNVITGVTDAGKSTIIKLIRWIKDNRPTGEEYKNWDADKDDQMAGEIVTDENTVAIIRKNNKVKYILNNDAEHPLEALNKEVPLEIAEALNFADYNIQTQFQPYFLLQDSPGEVASKINGLVGLDIIDTLYTNIASEIRETNKNIVACKEVIKNDKESLEKYQNLDEIEKLIKSIEENYQKTLEITSSVNLITKAVQSYEFIEKEWQNVNTIVKLEKTVNDLLKSQENLSSLEEKLNKIKSLTSSLTTIQEDIDSDNAWLDLEKPCDTLLSQFTELSELETKKTNVSRILESLKNIALKQTKEIELKNQYTKQYLNLLEKENICPISNIAFPKQCLTNIKNNL
jgi:energy-coupling factor transporter ATP-binding protein EcfA2